MATVSAYKPRYGPAKVPDQPTEAAMRIIRGNLEDLHAAASLFKLLLEGDGSVATPVLTNYLYLPGMLGGQAGTQLDATVPFLRLTQNASATATAGALLKLIGKNTSGSSTTSGTLLRAATSDDVTIFQLGSDGSTTINVPYTTYTTGNPIALTLQMLDNTSSAGTFFKIRTGTTPTTDVFAVDYYGGLIQTMSANFVAHYIRQSSGSTSDFLRLQTSALADLAGFTSAGRLKYYNGANIMTLLSTPTGARNVTIQDATHTLAGLEIAQTFTKAQTIQPDSDVVPLRVGEFTSGSTGSLLEIFDIQSGAGNVCLFANLSQVIGALLSAFGLHVGGDLFLWPGVAAGTAIGSGGSHQIHSAATAGRSFTLPNVTGTAMVVAGSFSRTNSTSVATATPVSTLANAAGGEYLVCTVINVGSVATTTAQKLTVTLNWEDARSAARTHTIAAGFDLTPLTNGPLNDVFNISAKAGTAITVTFAIAPAPGGANIGTYDVRLGASKVQ